MRNESHLRKWNQFLSLFVMMQPEFFPAILLPSLTVV